MEPQYNCPAIRWHKEIDSTNNEAKRKLQSIDNLSIIAAEYQTAGRGRGAHTWAARAGENLTFSLVLKFRPSFEAGQVQLPAAEAVRITHFITVAVSQFVEEEGLQPRIKWPNDIWVGDKKVCGILIENTFDAGNVAGSVIGVGLNLNQKEFDPNLPNPSSLGLLTGREYNIVQALEKLQKKFCHLADEMNSADGRAKIELEFSKRMFVLDKNLQDGINASIVRFEAQKQP